MLSEANQSSYEIPRRLWMVHSRCLPSLRKSRHTPTYARTSERTQMSTAGGAKSAYRLLGARLSSGERPTALILSCGVQKKPPLLLSASWRKENIATISGMNLTQYHCHWHSRTHKDDCSLGRELNNLLGLRRSRQESDCRHGTAQAATQSIHRHRTIAAMRASIARSRTCRAHRRYDVLLAPNVSDAVPSSPSSCQPESDAEMHAHTHTRAAACGRHALASAGRCACVHAGAAHQAAVALLHRHQLPNCLEADRSRAHALISPHCHRVGSA